MPGLDWLESKVREARQALYEAEDTASVRRLMDHLHDTEADLQAARKQLRENENRINAE